MLKALTIALIFLLSGCVSTTTTEIKENLIETKIDSPLITKTTEMDSYPQGDDLILISFSPRYAQEEDERTEALLSAAYQASLWYKLHLTYSQLIDEDVRGTLQIENIDIDYDQELALSLLEQLEILEEKREHDYYSLKVRLQSNMIAPFTLKKSSTNGVPDWIYKLPQFENYYSGVGLSGRRKSPSHSWKEADRKAAAELGKTINNSIKSLSGNIERGGISTTVSTSINKTLNRSEVDMKGFMILSRWSDGENYYSLAISRK